VNGVVRGSRFNTGKADSMRGGYRESKFSRRSVDIVIGFRLWVNGVIRPAYRIHQAYMYRCGMRYGYAGRNTVWNGYIGFRAV